VVPSITLGAASSLLLATSAGKYRTGKKGVRVEVHLGRRIRRLGGRNSYWPPKAALCYGHSKFAEL
jgi:hypothetical protein